MESKTNKSLNNRLKDNKIFIFLVIGIITGFIFILSLSMLYVQNLITNDNICSCVIPIPIMILVLSSLGIFVGSFISFFLLRKQETIVKNNFIIKDKMKKDIELFKKILFMSLNKDERKILEYLLNNPKTIQARISDATGLTRLQTFRTIRRLRDKGLVKTEREKKICQVELIGELKELFLK